jgi:LmbE family N-acetylglucosaminyl deacetylase
MNKLKLFADDIEPKILCLGAHSDDIEIGCGGTILRIIEEYPQAQFYWVVFSAENQRGEEAHKSAERFLNNVDAKVVVVQEFKDSYFPFIGGSIKDYFNRLKKEFKPDLIFTHFKNDAHQDHRLIGELTWNAYRNNFIIEYEIAKYDGDLGTPNFYVHLKESIVKEKIANICAIFNSQARKEWFGEESFRAIMRIRGLESNSPSKYSEAFYCRKVIV